MKFPLRPDRYTLGLVVLLVVLVAFKASYLDLPYYWDEAWVYAPAVKAMVANGPSLLPNAIPSELSRGHPLLFHAISALWMEVFGSGRTSAHAFSLLVAIGLCIATFRLGTLLGSRVLGLAATALLMVNETFLAQSGLLLPEVMVALCLVLAVSEYVVGRPWTYILAALCALWTKESAITLIAALSAWQLVRLSLSKGPTEFKEHLKWLGIVTIPLPLAASFFLVQKGQLGWYFYPEHLGMITWGLKEIGYKAKLVFTAVFEGQGMVILTYAFAIAAPLLHRKMPIHKRILTALLFVTAIKVLFGRWSLPGLPTLFVPLICFVAILITHIVPVEKENRRIGDLLGAAFLFCIAFWSFTSMNFYSDRYLLSMLPFVAVGAAGMLHAAFNSSHKQIAPVVIAVSALIVMSQIGKDERIGDTRLAYSDAIEMHKERIAFCEDQALLDERIYVSFMDIAYMTDGEAGYLSQGRAFPSVSNSLDDGTRYAFIGYDSPMELRDELRTSGFELLRRFTRGNAWGEIHYRPTPP